MRKQPTAERWNRVPRTQRSTMSTKVSISVDSNDQTRRRNLSAIVTLIHRGGAMARAELTRATGLNRATVGTLVAELVRAGIVVESLGVSQGTVGRPSALVAPAENIAVLAVNPETAGISFAVVGFGRGIIASSWIATDTTPRPEQTISLTRSAIAELVPAGTRLLGIGAAVPGVIRMDDGLVRDAPHLGWTHIPFAALLTEATGLPAAVANDAMLGALGESAFGLGRGVAQMVYLNGVSGIGGGIVTDGMLMSGETGAAGEFGHMVVDLRGESCHCGRRGCLETIVSFSRLASVAQENLTLDDLGEYLADVTDPAVCAELEWQVDALTVGLTNVWDAVDPRLIVLGGYLGYLFEHAEERIIAAVQRGVIASDSRSVRIVRGTSTPPMLPLGSAELAFRGFLDNPVATVESLTPEAV